MAKKKKVLTIITVYEDGSCSIIKPDNQATALDETQDPPAPDPNGGNNPPPPKDP